MKINYEVKFLDYWHISSGLSGGSLYDILVLKDKNNLPYIPGKTIKGLVRENLFNLIGESKTKELLGDEGEKLSKLYFSNALIHKEEYNEIVSNNLQEYLYDTLSFTKIDEKGIAVDDTLRDIEVVVPISLYGKIELIEEISPDDKKNLIKALKMIKRMGLNRNRGLGRCHIDIKEEQ
jgi:CRISPR/Cas system CSM-associated protein Csm3 (group 7 of RAMP superfamily)